MINNQILEEINYLTDNLNYLTYESFKNEFDFFYRLNLLDFIDETYKHLGTDSDEEEELAPKDEEGNILVGAASYLFYYDDSKVHSNLPLSSLSINKLIDNDNIFFLYNNTLEEIYRNFIFMEYSLYKLNLLDLELDYCINFLSCNKIDYLFFTDLDDYLIEDFYVEIFEYCYDMPHLGDIALPWFPWIEINNNKISLVLIPEFVLYERIWRDVSIDYLNAGRMYWHIDIFSYSQTFSSKNFWLPLFIFLFIDSVVILYIANKYFFKCKEYLFKNLNNNNNQLYNLYNSIIRYLLVSILVITLIYLAGNQIYWSIIHKHYIYFFKHVNIIPQFINLNLESYFLTNSFKKSIIILFQVDNLKIFDNLYSLIHFL